MTRKALPHFRRILGNRQFRRLGDSCVDPCDFVSSVADTLKVSEAQLLQNVAKQIGIPYLHQIPPLLIEQLPKDITFALLKTHGATLMELPGHPKLWIAPLPELVAPLLERCDGSFAFGTLPAVRRALELGELRWRQLGALGDAHRGLVHALSELVNDALTVGVTTVRFATKQSTPHYVFPGGSACAVPFAGADSARKAAETVIERRISELQLPLGPRIQVKENGTGSTFEVTICERSPATSIMPLQV